MTAPADVPSTFRVNVLGPFEVWCAGEPLPAGSWQRSVQTLLKLLATSPERRRLREEVVEILWPDATPQAGASNARYVVNLLRRELGVHDPSPIVSDRLWIVLNPAYTWDVDLARFYALVERLPEDRAAIEAVAELYRGEPFPEDRYEDWAGPIRTHIERTWQQACRGIARTLSAEGRREGALKWIERALEADPLDEESVEELLALLSRLGRRTEAMKRFHQFEGRLSEELGLEPGAGLRRIVSQLQDGPAPVVQRQPEDPAGATAAAGAMQNQVLTTGAYLGSLPTEPLVGRREELSRALTALDAATEGHGKLVLLAGEPGVGKTRLAQEVTRVVHERGFVVAAGRSYEPEGVVPYYPFLEILAGLHALVPQGLREEAPHRWPYLARLLPGLEPDVTLGRAAPMDGGAQEEPMLIRSAAGFLETIAACRPLALFLDDLHWSDTASVKLLLHVVRHTRTSRIFVLGTYRDGELTRVHPLYGAILDLSREGLLEKIALERLDAASTAELIADLLGDDRASPAAVEAIHRQTEGNPFFVGEVVRAGVEAGDLVRTDGRWELVQGAEGHVPEGVRAVVGQRLARLSPSTQEILFAAGVLGQAFRFQELERMAGRPESELEAALEEATRAGLVRETTPDIYGFSHALAQQAVYAEIPSRKRRRLHRLAAERLEADPEGRTRPAEIALHFQRAGEAERAVRYTILAGDAATRVFAHDEAERQFRSAAAASHEAGNASAEGTALERLAATLMITGRHAEAEDCARRALTIFCSVSDRDGELRATYRVSKTLQIQGRVRDALDGMRRLLDGMSDAFPSSSLAEAYLHVAWLEAGLGEFDRAAVAAAKAADIARAIDDEGLAIQAEFTESGAHFFLGRYADAWAIAERCLRFAEEHDDLLFLYHVLEPLGMESAYGGDLEGSKRYRQRLLEVARRIGDQSGIVAGLSFLGSARFLLGDWQGSRESLEEALEIARSMQNPGIIALPLLDLGHLTVCEGDRDTGEVLLREALDLSTRSGDLTHIRLVHLYLAQLELLRGRPSAVIENLTPLLDREGYEERRAMPLLPPLAQAYLDLGDVDRADEIASAALRRATEAGNRLDGVATLLVKAGVREQQGDADAARTALEQALTESRAMGFLLGEADALFRWGAMEASLGNAERAETHLREAMEIYRRLGAKKREEMAERALAKVGEAG